MFAAVPFGATVDDNAEFMLGAVLVTVVLLESDGSRDANLENWTAAEIAQVKTRVQEGMQWWTDTLALQNSVHDLSFQFDWEFADQPVATGYEPISRVSDDFSLWIDDFFAAANAPAGFDFSERIRAFNDQQRRDHNTNWAFTIFVVDSSNDADRRFASGGAFSQSFAYAGGRFFIATSERPASTFAHETGHMFWAVDEYAGGKPYSARRGYYNAQNTNGSDGHPNPDSRKRSIMDSHEIAYASHAISTSAMEMIGWRDSDADGIFDVLDVPHVLAGSGHYDASSGTYAFDGFAQVGTLANLNSSGTQHDMTINRIDVVQARMDGTTWVNVAAPIAYQSAVEFTVDVPVGTVTIEVRAVDLKSGVVSNLVSDIVDTQRPVWQNPLNPWDVNNDSFVSPLDALLIINRINTEGAGELTAAVNGPPYLDSNGDGYLSPIDALLVINQLNTTLASATLGSTTPNRSPSSVIASANSALATPLAEPWDEQQVEAEPNADFDVDADVDFIVDSLRVFKDQDRAIEPRNGLTWSDAVAHSQRTRPRLGGDFRYNEA